MADDMGTGKTFQGILFFLLSNKLDLFGNRPSVLVADPKLLNQWLSSFWSIMLGDWRDLDRLGRSIKGQKYTSEPKAIPWYTGQQAHELPQAAGSETLILCSAHTSQANTSSSVALTDRAWGLVLCDEAHRLH